jgi:photosystem II stability/assembly factor-like uncharacterized protein
MRAATFLAGAALAISAPLSAQSANTSSTAIFHSLQYRSIGPSRGGRVTAVAGHRAQPHTFYMGATGGGVWKSDDYGQSWTNISDGYFATGSIGAIRVAPSDPDIIYVGTGSDGIRSNVIGGRGVYRSADGGETWEFIGLRDVGQIGAVEIHPTNPDIVFVAAIGHAFGPSPMRGVYRSTDGGRSWDHVLFVSDSTGAVDLELAPDNPQEVYAAMWRGERKPWTIISGAYEGGIYKSTDGGDSWEQLTNGLPDGLVGKSDLAVSTADPDRLYVLMEAAPGGGLYRSDDRGGSFELVSTQSGILNRPFYYTNVDADPSNADVVYIGNEGFYRSSDGGRTFQRRRTPHGDNHDMWINPDDPDLYIQSNDGGANVTRDGGITWSTQHNQPTAELYQADVDDQFPYWVYAGQQDNSTIAVPSMTPYSLPGGPTAYWRSVGGCETGPAVPKPGDPDIVYANCKGRFGRYSKRTGQEKQYYVGAANMYGHNPRDLAYRFQRVSPIEISPHDANVVYHGSQFLHVTRDEGVTWETISPDLTAFEPDKQVISGEPITRDITGEEFYSTLYAIEESPLVRGLIWTGANDGPIHVTRDGGETWTDVTPGDLPSGGRVQTIDPSPHRPEKAYVAVYRYLLGDWQPYIYRTTDYGNSWTRLTTGENGIPADHPTRVVREDPDREGLLYAGTEFGMFISFDDGASWQPFQQNLPVTPVTDIKVYRQDLVLSTMGRSFWILDNVTPLHQWTPGIEAPGHELFAPRPAYRLRTRGAGTGAAIDYYIDGEPAGDLAIEILDSAGNVVRTFTEGAPRRQPTVQQAMLARFGGGSQSPGKVPGLNRFTWDFRVAGPVDPSTGRSVGTGPLAVPGTYRVRLSIGDWSATQDLEVLLDPRVAADGVTPADLEEQFDLIMKVSQASIEARTVLERLREVRSGLPAANESRARLDALEAQLVTDPIRYSTPMLIDQLRYLSGMISRADQKVGRDALLRYEELTDKLATIAAEVEQLAR